MNHGGEEVISDFDKLTFCRDEVKHEFGLLAMRSTILVTCQSFLVVPMAILHTAADFRVVLPFVYLVAALGIFVIIILKRPIDATHRILNFWMVKQRQIIKNSGDLEDLATERDRIPGSDRDISRDPDHVRSLAFGVYGPWAFFIFWVLVIVLSTLRAVYMT
jgi:hypothetical protein